MALSFQNIDLILRRGFSGAKDPHTLDAELSTLRNAEFVGSNVVAKRPGYSSVSNSKYGGGTIGAASMIAGGDVELSVFGENAGYRKTSLGFTSGTQYLSTVDTVADTSTVARALYADCGVINGLVCVAWTVDYSATESPPSNATSHGSCRSFAAVYDTSTQAWLSAPKEIGGGIAAVKPRVVCLSDRFLIFTAATNGGIFGDYITTAAPGTVNSVLTTNTGSATANLLGLDACKNSADDTAFVSYIDSAGTVTTRKVSNVGVSTANATWVRGQLQDAMHVFQFLNGNVGVVADDGVDLRVRVYDSSLALVGTTGALSGYYSGTWTATQIISADSTLTAGRRTVYWTDGRTVRAQDVTNAGAAAASSVSSYNAYFASQAFSIFSTSAAVLALPAADVVSGTVPDAGDLQAVGAIVPSGSSSGAVFTPFANLPSDVVVSTSPSHVTTSSTKSYFALIRGTQRVSVLVTDTAGASTINALEEVTAGALPTVWDGQTAAESNALVAPVVTSVTAGGVGTLTGSFSVVAVYERTDAKGRRLQSAPSNAVSVSASSNLTLTAVATTLTASLVPISGSTGWQLVFYRTDANGTVYYRDRATGPAGTSAATVSIGLTRTDATLTTREILYTVGGVLPNEAAPACRHVAEHRGRVVFSGLLDPKRLAYSQATAVGEGLRCSYDYLSADIPEADGRVVATASMDDKLVILAEKRPYVLTGEGPNDTGADNSFFLQPVQEAVQADWAYPRSVLTSSLGVWYKSERGMRCLSRNLSLLRQEDGQFVGAETDSLVTACVASVAHPTRPQLWFFVGSGAVAVYDFQWGQWSEFSNFSCTHACVYGDTIAFCTSAGALFQTDTAVWKDNGSAITSTIETGWLSVANIHGFQRVRRAFFTAQDLAAAGGDIKFEFAYDGNATYSTSDAPTVTVSGSNLLSYRHHLAQQKCSSIRLKVTLQGSASTPVGAFRVTALGLEVGRKYGGPKLPSGQSL